MADEIDKLIDDEAEYGADTIVVTAPLSVYQKTYLPVKSGAESLRCVFKKMTVEDGLLVEKMSFITKLLDNKIDVSSCDYQVYRKLLLRRCLLKMGDWELKRQNNWIVKEDWAILLKMNAMILSYILGEYELSVLISEEEERQIDRQSSILFGSENGKLMNPLPCISNFCTLSSAWEKFGLSIEKIKQMRQEDYVRFRAIMAKEVEISKRDIKK